MILRTARLLAALLLCAGGPAWAGDGAPKPQRIVSLNLCADELLLRLVEPGRIASVTWLARDPRGSTVAAIAAGIPVNRGLAEEIVPLHPDLIVGGKYTTRTAAGLLKRLNAPLVELDVPQTPEDVAGQIRALARTVGEPERGEALIAAMMARYAAAAPAPGDRRPTAVVLRPNGFVAGPGTLTDAVMARAGLKNMAGQLPGGGFGPLPLEAILLGGTERLIVDDAPGRPPSLANAVLHHPAVAALSRRVRTVTVPSRLLTCAGPQNAEAAVLLAAARGDGP